MRYGLVMFGMAVALTGCTRFSGEWIEEGVVNRDGSVSPIQADRRAAVRFDWPATVRYGAYTDKAGVVDNETVQWDTYWTLQSDRVAQFGPTSARIVDGKLVTIVAGDVEHRFTKVKGPSVFPPQVKFPSLSAQ